MNSGLSWNSRSFLWEYSSLRHRNAYYGIKQLRVDEYKNTIAICTEGSYVTEEGVEVSIDDMSMRKGSLFYSKLFNINSIPANASTTNIVVKNIDCIEECLLLQEQGYNPAVLNMANRHTPGGGVMEGSGAQEETLFRRTNLFRSLYQFISDAGKYGLEERREHYSMDKDYGGIYTPNAVLFRANESEGYKLLPTLKEISFISVAGVNHPQLKDATRITDDVAETTKRKMRTILRIGLVNGHDSLVLGAIGCGSFCNPPSHVAQLFHDVILEPEFLNKYRHISFAILDNNVHRSHNPEGNFIPFEREFNMQR